MLTRLLSIIDGADGPVTMDDLSRRLGVERSALAPMLDLLERRGLLTEWHQDETAVACGTGGCGTSCHGIKGCPLVVGGMPHTFTLLELGGGSNH